MLDGDAENVLHYRGGRGKGIIVTMLREQLRCYQNETRQFHGEERILWDIQVSKYLLQTKTSKYSMLALGSIEVFVK